LAEDHRRKENWTETGVNPGRATRPRQVSQKAEAFEYTRYLAPRSRYDLSSKARSLMLAHASSQSDHFARGITESPAILGLKLLEATFASKAHISDDARRSAHDLIAALRRKIAECPSLTFADVVAKLKTYGGMDRDAASEPLDEMKKAMLKNALAEFARLQPPAGRQACSPFGLSDWRRTQI
jgi:hypothetical protein